MFCNKGLTANLSQIDLCVVDHSTFGPVWYVKMTNSVFKNNRVRWGVIVLYLSLYLSCRKLSQIRSFLVKLIDSLWVVAFLQNIGAILWPWGWLKRRFLVLLNSGGVRFESGPVSGILTVFGGFLCVPSQMSHPFWFLF